MQYSVGKFSTSAPIEKGLIQDGSFRKEGNEILCIGFSHDSQLIACGMTHGFAVYNIRPIFRELLWMEYTDAEIFKIGNKSFCNYR